MFRVHYVDECQGGSTDTKVFWDLGDGIKEEKKFFWKRENANDYLGVVKLTYASYMLSAYVKKSKMLMEIGNREIYKTANKIESMNKCHDLIGRMKDMKLIEICFKIIDLQEDMEAILPVQTSPSHQMSYFQLKSLIRFAKREVEENRISNPFQHKKSINITTATQLA